VWRDPKQNHLSMVKFQDFPHDRVEVFEFMASSEGLLIFGETIHCTASEFCKLWRISDSEKFDPVAADRDLVTFF